MALQPISDGPKPKNVLHWFRRGLRLHDNPALLESIQGATTFRCVYILDPWFAAGTSQVSVNKWRFLIQCLEDLDSSLAKLNSRLFLIQGQPANVFPKLFKEWDISHLSFEEDPEPYGSKRDAAITASAQSLGVDVIVRTSHTLFNLQRILQLNGGLAPITYKKFQSILSCMEPPSRPVDAVSLANLGRAHTPISEDHDEKYGIPTLDQLGFDTEKLLPAVWRGGEAAALDRLERHLERKAWVATFERPKMMPQSLSSNQTGVSPYLRFGCLSPRFFYWKLTNLYRMVHKRSEPPLSLHGQLLWREYFYTLATNNTKFDVMLGNPICIQIPWDKHPVALAKWAEGKTGFPWIDAIMMQLRQEGWIHNICRHAVACFLTRGHLWSSWEEGMKVFDELLLDADWSTNAGMWLWLSCSSFFQPFLHSHCPVKFGKIADPNGDYIRRYIPVLKNFPKQYIFEPWLAPENVQRACKCVIGRDYPLPMVDHTVVGKINFERMKQVFKRLLTPWNIQQSSSSSGLKRHSERTPDIYYGKSARHGITHSSHSVYPQSGR
ncbi:cryptochrome-1-like [Lineus longissimus]|uniref:cryptochrome-1-like n=1 Tax=Lineus longissimus TaxID=88925 RepID=UPI002B4C575C